jgi:hypothetical protein
MKKLLFVCLAVFAAELLSACSCIGQKSVQEEYKDAAIVFSGKVVFDSLVQSTSPGGTEVFTKKRFRFSNICLFFLQRKKKS